MSNKDNRGAPDDVVDNVVAYDADNVVAYYTETWLSRLRRGHNPRSRAIHFGLMGDAPPDPCEAKLRTNLEVHAALRGLAGRPARVADLGCGVGGTVLHLARLEPEWRFVAVNIGADQLAMARELALEAGVLSRIELNHASFTSLTIEDATLDAAYAIESLCHASDRALAVRTIARALRPGGSFCVIDFFRTDAPLDAASYRAVRHGFRIADYYDEPIEPILLAAGVRVVGVESLSAAVLPALRRSAARAAASAAIDPRHAACLEPLRELVASGALDYRCVVARRV